MYIVPKYEPKIRLISQNGVETIFNNYEEFLERNSEYFVRNHVVTTFKDWPIGTRGRQYYFLINRRDLDLYIVRDEFGSVFSAGEIIKDHEKRSWQKIRHSIFGTKFSHHVYRKNPVPGTGKNRWHFGSYYKKPRTTQEKTWSIAHEKYVRGKRKKHALPDSWEDMPRADMRTRRSWKKQKKRKQWM